MLTLSRCNEIQKTLYSLLEEFESHAYEVHNGNCGLSQDQSFYNYMLVAQRLRGLIFDISSLKNEHVPSS